ncbi:MAG TPA: zinc ribbon domain-containing protein [Methanomassiliicoccales archaeon]|nr:zinc ribbon domain-containing protein [Methanomassiliicoccales archaeon]
MADDNITLVIYVLIIITLGVAVYYELKFIRNRKKKREDDSGTVDDIYNSIITTTAIASALKARGYSTKEVDLVMIDAQAAYERGNILSAKGSVTKAKSLLKDLQGTVPAPIPTQTSVPKETQLRSVEDSGVATEHPAAPKEVPFQEARKLPENYLESKFIIASVSDALAKAKDEGKNVSEPEELLTQAKQLYGKGEYTEALKYAMRAKRRLAGEDEEPEAPKPVKQTPAPEADKQKQKYDYCRNCNSLVDEGDTFCRRCGQKVERVPHCPSCGAEVANDDVFCRKCGSQLKSAFSCPVCGGEVAEDDPRCPSCRTPLK